MTARWPASSPSISSGRSRARSRSVRLDRPERKNPLTFESYAELRDTFRDLVYADDVDAVVFLPNGGNFCSGGDVHDIIGPLVEMDMKELLAFTRMTGDFVKAMLNCGKPIIAAVDGVAVGAGAIIAMAVRHPHRHAGGQDRIPVHPRRACRLRHGRLRDPAAHHRPGPRRRTALHRPHHERRRRRALGLLQPAGRCRERWKPRRSTLARRASSSGPTFAHGITKTQLNQEWSMSLDQAIEAEAQAQAICMQTRDFERAYRAFVAKDKPCSRAIEWPTAPSSPGRSSTTAIATWPSGWRAGAPTNLPVAHDDVDAACRELVAQPRPGRLAEADRGSTQANPARSTCARCASAARRWPVMTGSPISPSPCRGSAPGALSLFGNAGAAALAGANPRRPARSRPLPFRSRAPAPMSPTWRSRPTRDGDGLRLDGEKTWISNGGIADLYVVFARTGEAPGAKGLSAFLVPADAPGLTVAERLEVIAPHPLARLAFDSVRVAGRSADRQAAATDFASPCRCSTCSAPPSAPRRSALPAVRWTKA